MVNVPYNKGIEVKIIHTQEFLFRPENIGHISTLVEKKSDEVVIYRKLPSYIS